MPVTIQQLSSVDTVNDGDALPIFALMDGEARKVAASVLAAYLQGKIASTDDKLTQYAAPSATAFNITINNDNLSVWLVLTPTAGFAAGTLTLPALANCIDKQEIIVNTTQAVTALTVAGNGATVTGAPTTLAANAFFHLRFDGVTKTWYRIG